MTDTVYDLFVCVKTDGVIQTWKGMVHRSGEITTITRVMDDNTEVVTVLPPGTRLPAIDQVLHDLSQQN